MTTNPSTEHLTAHIPLDDLMPHPRNYNAHPVAQIARLQASLRAYGQPRPIVIHRGVILAGHGVYMAARAEGWHQLWCSIVPDAWDEGRALAYLVADNETRRGAEADEEALLQLIEETRGGVGLEALGFDEGALQALMDEVVTLPEPGEGGDDFDAAPDDEGPTRAQLGDMWIIGGVHRLIVGDCTDPAVVERLMGDEVADLSEIDPPYEMDAMQQAAVCAAATGTIALWGMSFELIPVCQAWGRWPDLDLVWRFHFGRMYSKSRPFCHHRNIWLFGLEHYNADWRGENNAPPSTFFEAAYVSQHHAHEKPLSVVMPILEQYSLPGAIVYAPFGGSGATLIAAHRTGRRCYGCEIEPRYADVILRRAEAEGLTVERMEP